MDETKIIAEHKQDKRGSDDFKKRRFPQWNENYALYRDQVITNRLTQRQPVNIPIMRETIQTWISKIDEPPLLTFESRTRDNVSVDGEIVLNELWNYTFDKEKLDLVDNLDKKIVGLQGRSFKKWGFAKNEVFCDIIDPYDIDIDPMVNPLDLNSASFLIHKAIYKPLREILANPKYDASAKNTLKLYLNTKQGVIAAKDAQDSWQKRQARLMALGAHNFDELQATDTLVEINESYKLVWHTAENRFVRHLRVIAMDAAVLYDKPLKDAIGIDILPIVSWADDPDLNDIWCDGKGDSVRQTNKIINLLYSQDIENRAYRNFGMYFFDTMGGDFQPQAFDPKPFGMYGVPGNPKDIIQQMEINPLGDTTPQIQFLKEMIQTSVAQTPSDQGVADPSTGTLGEIKLNLQQSQGRNEVTAKNYRRAWKESGIIFYELLNANSRGQITLWKQGLDGEYRSKTVMPSDWQNPKGYECKVVYKAEKEADDQFALQKAQYVAQAFGDNPVALKIAKKKELEVLGWSQDEIDQAMAFYDQQAQAPQLGPDGKPLDPAAGDPQPGAVLSPMQPQAV